MHTPAGGFAKFLRLFFVIIQSLEQSIDVENMIPGDHALLIHINTNYPYTNFTLIYFS